MARYRPSFIRTSNGAEVDLVVERGGRKVAFECKLSKAPRPSRGFFELVSDLHPDGAWLVAPVDEPCEYRGGGKVANLAVVQGSRACESARMPVRPMTAKGSNASVVTPIFRHWPLAACSRSMRSASPSP